MRNKIKRAAAAEYPRAVENRRYIHQHPCASFHEEETAAYLCRQLQEEGIPFTRCGQNGIVARLKGDGEGPVIAFRADFDALPIQEPEGLPFASRNPGVMHACGHDAHAAVLLGLARVLGRNREWLRGEAVFIFQYAEELPPGGAGPMIEAGCLEGVDRIYGLHVSDELDAGTVGVCPGKYMAASDSFFITFTGNGGHGSRPDETPDTVLSAASAIIEINTIISRFVPPRSAAVVSVCNIHGGKAYNVLPSQVSIEGTVRTYEAETAELIRGKLALAAQGAAAFYGADLDFRFEYGYPPVVNTERETALVRSAAEKLGLPFTALEPTPVGEDFSRYLQRVPGAFFRVGIRNPALDAVYPLHNSRFRIDEEGMRAGLEMFLGIYLTETGQM